jgi:hypothetical protein
MVAEFDVRVTTNRGSMPKGTMVAWYNQRVKESDGYSCRRSVLAVRARREVVYTRG